MYPLWHLKQQKQAADCCFNFLSAAMFVELSRVCVTSVTHCTVWWLCLSVCLPVCHNREPNQHASYHQTFYNILLPASLVFLHPITSKRGPEGVTKQPNKTHITTETTTPYLVKMASNTLSKFSRRYDYYRSTTDSVVQCFMIITDNCRFSWASLKLLQAKAFRVFNSKWTK